MLEMVETSDARQLKEIVESQLMRGAVVEAEKTCTKMACCMA